MGTLPQHIDAIKTGATVAGTSVTDLVAPDSGDALEIEFISAHNSDSESRWVELIFNNGTSDFTLLKWALDAGGNESLMDILRPGNEPLCLQNGEKLRVKAEVADKITVYAWGGVWQA